MNEKSIAKLRSKFIGVSMMALLLAMLFVATLLYFVNVIASRQIIEETLDVVIKHDGDIGEVESSEIKRKAENDGSFVRFLDDIFQTGIIYESEEFAYSLRYFSVIYNSDGAVTHINTSHIAAIDDIRAMELGNRALDHRFDFGRDGTYYYKYAKKSDGTTVVVYMDAATYLQNSRRLLHTAILLIAFGMAITYLFVYMFSKNIVKTEIMNAELQKQFITNASHELKTPLAVIKANNEMTEMLEGESEWTKSTTRQIDRMNGLIKNLVLIARSEEGESGEIVRLDVGRVMNETADSFKSLSYQDSKDIERKIDNNVYMNANEASIRQLATLLLDNAIKYCDDGGTVGVSLNQRGKVVYLSVYNAYAAGKDVDYTRFFERFYREDSSHNVDRGGYGIGLSIAEDIVKRYKGSINVSWKDGIISFNCVLRSMKSVDNT